MSKDKSKKSDATSSLNDVDVRSGGPGVHKGQRSGQDGEAIGIDLGGSFACAAVYQNQKIDIIQNERGSRKTPCYVAFTANGILVGESAMEQGKRNVKNLLFGSKRFLGSAGINDPAENLPFNLKHEDSKLLYEIEHNGAKITIKPEHLCVYVLKKMKTTAETFLRKHVTMAVVSVPSHFTSEQRMMIKEACQLAGMNLLDLINEPTAAVIGYTVDKEVQSQRVFLVYDLGGSKLNVSIVNVARAKYKVLAMGGDSQLGGEFFNDRMFNHFADIIKERLNFNVRSDRKAIHKLRLACEKIKMELSISQDVSYEIDALCNGEDFLLQINRDTFENLNKDLFARSMDCVGNVLQEAKLSADKIDNVLLVGGSVRIPKIQHLLQKIFKASQFKTGINADEVVAYGAAVKAMTRTNPFTVLDLQIEELSPFNYVINHGNAYLQFIFARNTVIKNAKKELSFWLDEKAALELQIYKNNSTEGQPKDLMSVIQLKEAGTTGGKFWLRFEIDENGIFSYRAIEDPSRTVKIEVTNLKEPLTTQDHQKNRLPQDTQQKDSFAQDSHLVDRLSQVPHQKESLPQDSHQKDRLPQDPHQKDRLPQDPNQSGKYGEDGSRNIKQSNPQRDCNYSQSVVSAPIIASVYDVHCSQYKKYKEYINADDKTHVKQILMFFKNTFDQNLGIPEDNFSVFNHNLESILNSARAIAADRNSQLNFNHGNESIVMEPENRRGEKNNEGTAFADVNNLGETAKQHHCRKPEDNFSNIEQYQNSDHMEKLEFVHKLCQNKIDSIISSKELNDTEKLTQFSPFREMKDRLSQQGYQISNEELNSYLVLLGFEVKQADCTKQETFL